MRLRSTLCMITIAAVVLTACGGGSSSTEPPGDGNTVQVQAFDRQDYNADDFSAVAGEITFRLSQIGVQEHTLTVEGLEDQMRLVAKNGGTDSGKLTLEPGRYVLYCDIAGHRVSGMEARLTVG
jgi:plastocyanin